MKTQPKPKPKAKPTKKNTVVIPWPSEALRHATSSPLNARQRMYSLRSLAASNRGGGKA